MKALTIIHLLPWQSINTVGGTEIFVKKIASLQAKHENKIIIALPSFDSMEHLSYESANTIYQFPHPNPTGNVKISSGLQAPESLEYWVKFIKKEFPLILHIHAFEPYLIWLIKKAKERDIKIIFTPHVAKFTCLTGSLIQNGNAKCNGLVEKSKCNKCLFIYKYKHSNKRILPFCIYKKMIFLKYCLKSLQNMHLDLYPEVNSNYRLVTQLNSFADKIVSLTDDYNQVLLKNGFTNDKVVTVKYKYNLNSNLERIKVSKPFNLAFIGRLSPEKGIHILLKALNMITEPIQIEVNLYGKTEAGVFDLGQEIKKITNPGIKIMLHGVTDPEKMKKEYDNIHILCIPSTIYEMSPLVIQEAFENGIPVIGSNLGGIAEYVIEGFNGLLFEPNDYLQLAENIQKLYNDTHLYKKLVGNIKHPFGYKQIADDLLAIYQTCYNK